MQILEIIQYHKVLIIHAHDAHIVTVNIMDCPMRQRFLVFTLLSTLSAKSDPIDQIHKWTSRNRVQDQKIDDYQKTSLSSTQNGPTTVNH